MSIWSLSRQGMSSAVLVMVIYVPLPSIVKNRCGRPHCWRMQPYRFRSLLFILLMIFPRPSEYIPLVLGNTLFSIFAFFVVARAAEGKFKGWFASVLENRAVMHLGKISYGIYLFHFFMPDLYNYTSEHFKFIEGITWFKKIFLFLSSIIIAQLSWTIIEAPVVRLKKKINY